jgi:hypothetical protein
MRCGWMFSRTLLGRIVMKVFWTIVLSFGPELLTHYEGGNQDFDVAYNLTMQLANSEQILS